MESSIFLAKLLGPYCIIVAVGVLFNLKSYQKVMEDFFKNSALLYLGGVMALLFGLLIVLFHNLWAANWTVVITIFGWAGIIKGIWLIILPDSASKMTVLYRKNTALLKIHLLIIIALGVFLTVMGYFVV